VFPKVLRKESLITFSKSRKMLKKMEIKGKVYEIDRRMSRMTLGQYATMLKAQREFESCRDALNKESTNDSLINFYVALAELMTIFLKVPREDMLGITPESLAEVWKEFAPVDDLDQNFVPWFDFRDASVKEIEDYRANINDEAPVWKIWKYKVRKEMLKKLSRMEKVRYFISGDLGNDTLAQWIGAENARKKIINLQNELKGGSFDVLPEIIATIARPEGEEYSSKEVIRRREIFKDLDLLTAYRIGSFFLKIQMKFLKRIKTFSNLIPEKIPPQTQSESTASDGDGSFPSET